jgi:hypothetical protein
MLLQPSNATTDQEPGASMSEAPAVQASYMKNLFAALDALGHLAALGSADAALLREVAAAPRLSWLPVAVNVRTVEAMAARFGEQRGSALLAECVYRQFDTALWKHFIRNATRLLGTEPGSLGRWLPEAFSLVFRGCGRFSVDLTGELELTVRVDDLPAMLAAHRLWLDSLAIGMTPLFTVCGRHGDASLVEVSQAERRARYVLRWKANR